MSIWASQPGYLSAIARSAPTTTGITMILTIHSCSNSIFNDWYLSICSSFFVLVVLITWPCDANYEAGLFLVVNQHDGRRIVNQVLVGLGGEVPADFGSWLLFLALPTSLYCAQACTQDILYTVYCILCILYTIEAPFLCTRLLWACCSRWWYVPRFLHVVCTTCILDLAQCCRSRVPLPWCWGPALELPWSEPWCSLGCCLY